MAITAAQRDMERTARQAERVRVRTIRNQQTVINETADNQTFLMIAVLFMLAAFSVITYCAFERAEQKPAYMCHGQGSPVFYTPANIEYCKNLARGISAK